MPIPKVTKSYSHTIILDLTVSSSLSIFTLRFVIPDIDKHSP
jgi:hypothetical protein